MGESSLTADQLAAYVLANNPSPQLNCSVKELASYFLSEGRAEGVRGDIAFCQAIQSASPFDSHVVPEPWDMPGYGDPVIMAAGTFVQGASLELSADAPIKEPYIGYLQGGLTLEHIQLALMLVLERMVRERLIEI